MLLAATVFHCNGFLIAAVQLPSSEAVGKGGARTLHTFPVSYLVLLFGF